MSTATAESRCCLKYSGRRCAPRASESESGVDHGLALITAYCAQHRSSYMPARVAISEQSRSRSKDGDRPHGRQRLRDTQTKSQQKSEPKTTTPLLHIALICLIAAERSAEYRERRRRRADTTAQRKLLKLNLKVT